MSHKCVNTAFLSQKIVNKAFLLRKFINTRSSIDFKDLVDSSIAPHIKPHCKGEGEFSKCGSFGWRFNKFYAEEHSCWCHLALSSASPMLSSLPQPLQVYTPCFTPPNLPLYVSSPVGQMPGSFWVLCGACKSWGTMVTLVKMLAFFLPQYCAFS